MHRAFTLIEMMVVIAIIGLTLTIGMASISAGKGAARVKGAARDVHAAIRHARSVALVTGQRVLVNFSNETVDGESMAKVEVVSAKIISTDPNRPDPQPYYVKEYKSLPQASQAQKGQELVHIRGSEAKGLAADGETAADATSGGETIEEYFFSPMSEDVVKGMRIKVLKGDEALADETAEQARSRISVFSNVDYLQSRYQEAKKEAKAKAEDEGKDDDAKTSGSVNDMVGTVGVVWETNGAVEPHRIWVYPDGGKPEDGLLLNVDRFGAIKVLNGDGKEDD